MIYRISSILLTDIFRYLDMLQILIKSTNT